MPTYLECPTGIPSASNGTATNNGSLSSAVLRKLAFVFYAASERHLCAALVNAAVVRELSHGADFDVLVMVTPEFGNGTANASTFAAERNPGDDVTFVMLDHPPAFPHATFLYYRECYHKLQLFALYAMYARVIYLDVDGLVLRDLAPLFHAPLHGAVLGAPLAAWLPGRWLTSAFMVVDLSEELWTDILAVLTQPDLLDIARWLDDGRTPYDMEVVNYLFNHDNTSSSPWRSLTLDAKYLTLDSLTSTGDRPYYVHFSAHKPLATSTTGKGGRYAAHKPLATSTTGKGGRYAAHKPLATSTTGKGGRYAAQFHSLARRTCQSVWSRL